MNHYFVSVASWEESSRTDRRIYQVPEDVFKRIDEILREDPDTVELLSFF